MKNPMLMIAASALLAGSVFAQTTAPAATAAPQAKAMPASSAVHVMCKDHTSFDGASRNGACSGHGGIDKKATAGMSADRPMASAPAADKATKAAPVTMAQAAGGGDGKVWVNTSSKVYHCQGDKYYGKTKHGEYMMEADAKTKGFHVSHGKACAA
jgi:hypothetical protein